MEPTSSSSCAKDTDYDSDEVPSTAFYTDDREESNARSSNRQQSGKDSRASTMREEGRSRPGHTVAQVRAQDWLDFRTANVTLASFGTEKVVIYTTYDTEPPTQFRDIWHVLCHHHGNHQLSEAEQRQLVAAEVVLIFTDILDVEHAQGAMNIAQGICSLGAEAPPVVLVPHTMHPELRPVDDLEAEFSILSESLASGMDEVILGEPCGIKLAWEVRSRIMRQGSRADELNNKLNSHRNFLRYICDVEDGIEESVWDYLRVRLVTTLPPIGDDIEEEAGMPVLIDGLICGQKLGEGAFGSVVKLMDPSDMSLNVGQVLKLVQKKPLTDFQGILGLKRQLKIMRQLSAEATRHENIARFFDVYHTDSYILFRIEDGGPLDLYRRLVLLERREMPMDKSKFASIIKQIAAGLAHMHLVAEVAHRDIKPENIITAETPTSIMIKISDFDTCQIVKNNSSCHGVIGTFPFMAPEVILTAYYDPLPPDMWSMGVVFLEVLCCLSILKKALSFPHRRRGMGHADKKEYERQMIERIQTFFTNDGGVVRLLEQFFRPGLNSLFAECAGVLTGVLTVDIDERWDAIRLREACTDLFSDAAEESDDGGCSRAEQEAEDEGPVQAEGPAVTEAEPEGAVEVTEAEVKRPVEVRTQLPAAVPAEEGAVQAATEVLPNDTAAVAKKAPAKVSAEVPMKSSAEVPPKDRAEVPTVEAPIAVRAGVAPKQVASSAGVPQKNATEVPTVAVPVAVQAKATPKDAAEVSVKDPAKYNSNDLALVPTQEPLEMGDGEYTPQKTPPSDDDPGSENPSPTEARAKALRQTEAPMQVLAEMPTGKSRTKQK